MSNLDKIKNVGVIRRMLSDLLETYCQSLLGGEYNHALTDISMIFIRGIIPILLKSSPQTREATIDEILSAIKECTLSTLALVEPQNESKSL